MKRREFISLLGGAARKLHPDALITVEDPLGLLHCMSHAGRASPDGEKTALVNRQPPRSQPRAFGADGAEPRSDGGSGRGLSNLREGWWSQSHPQEISVDHSRLARGGPAATPARAVATETETGGVSVAIPRLLTKLAVGSGPR
jgi:hypothetical protein